MQRLHVLVSQLASPSANPCKSVAESSSSSQSVDAPIDLSEPSEELVSQHLAGSGVLWQGPSSHIKKALDLFFERGVTNFPQVNVMEKKQEALELLRRVLDKCEREMPKRPVSAWGTRQILLTGATGFIGIHFLVKLLRAFPEANIWCLVRGRSLEHCMERLHATARQFSLDEEIGQAWSRVIGVAGDIARPRLGLAAEVYDKLAGTVETVVHLAAKDNFFLPFEVLQKPHIDGVRNVIEFCASCSVKSLMAMSTCKIRLIQELQGKVIPNDALYDGYAQTKYVGHCMVEEVAGLKGKLQCAPPVVLVNMAYVHLPRSPPLIPDISDAWEVVMKVCLERGVCPEIEVPMDFVSMGYGTDCLIEILEDSAAGRLDEHKGLEIFSPHGLNFRDVREALEEYLGHPPRLVPIAEFARHWQELLWEQGTTASKCLSIGVSRTFVEQTTTVFSVGPNLYRSQKHTPPKISKGYLLELLRTIDTKMVLNR